MRYKKIENLRRLLVFFLQLIGWILFGLVSFVILMVIFVETDDLEVCLDVGICKEGVAVRNPQGERVVINKENCLKYNWSWNEERKSCDVRAGSR